MDFDRIVRSISSLGLNLYDFALYTPEGVRTHRFQPCNNCANSYSVAKVFIVSALGILADEGRIRLSDPLSAYFVFPDNADPRFKTATIEDAVKHRLGFDEGFLDIDTEDTTAYPTDDYLSIVLTHPLAYAPGTHEQYSDAAYYLLSRLISKVTGERADTFINRRLLRPLHFHEAAWSRCPHEYPIGATGLYISSEDMVKLGALYLNGGVWEGKQLISREWVNTAITREYEMHPLAPEDSSSDLTGKWGMYGQLLVFSKERKFAAAFHAHIEDDSSHLLTEYLSRI